MPRKKKGGFINYMATVKKIIDVSEPLTEEEKRMLEEAEKRPIVYDEDSPEIREEDLIFVGKDSDIRHNGGRVIAIRK